MKKLLYLLALAFIASSTFIACDKDDDASPMRRVKIGAQENTTIGGLYSFNNETVYTLEQASQNQSTIDLLCFYENTPDRQNNITLASPGANIRDIFEGDNAPGNWDITDTTYFYQLETTDLTITQFDALNETDVLIETLYNEEESKRKAKDLKVDDIYAFNTEDNYYGILKVVAVTQGATGSVEIEYILKK